MILEENKRDATLPNVNLLSIIRTLVILLGLLFFTFLVSFGLDSNPFAATLPGYDSSMFRYFGFAMSQGDTLYTEIFDHKGPVIFLLNYLAANIHVADLDGLWILENLSLFVFFVFTYKTMRLWNDRIISFVPVVIFSLAVSKMLIGGNFTEEFALPAIACSLYVFARYYTNGHSFRLYEIVLLGAAFVYSFLLRPNLIAVWIAFCLFIFLEFLVKKDFFRLFKVIGAFIGGMLLVSLPIVLYLSVNQALAAGFYQTWTFNLLYLGDSENLADSILSQLDLLNEYYLLGMAGVFGLVYLFTLLRKSSPAKGEKVLLTAAVFFLLLSFYFTFMSGRPYKHYLLILIPAFTLPVAFLCKNFFGRFKNSLLSLLILFLVMISFAAPVKDHIQSLEIKNNAAYNEADGMTVSEQNIANHQKTKNLLLKAASFIQENTAANERIYVHKLGGNLYLQSGRLSSVKYFNLPAIDLDMVPEVAADFLQEFEQSETRIVVLGISFVNSAKNQTDQQFYDYITENYQLIYDESGYLVYERNDA